MTRYMRYLLLAQCLVAAGLVVLQITVLHVRNAWLALAISIVLVVLVRLSITANSFRLAWRFRSETPVPARINLRQTTRLFCTEFLASMLSSSWSMAFHAFEKKPARHPVGLPVLLIHGYGCNSGYWRSLSRRLSAANITHHAVNLEPVLADIDSYVPSVEQAITTLIHDTGSDQVVLVAHSMGGLVARACLRAHGDNRIAKVIMLGTPHHGTALARHGIGINAQQMRCNADKAGMVPSDWLQQLNRCEDIAHRAMMVSIYSHHDNIVAPQRSCHLDGATNIAVQGIGHVALALDQGVQQQVIDEIRSVRVPPRARRNRSTS
ncbi:alpha/beta fold hydrolase [Actimicrobium antarcticum]|uniref:alpha/beta fold hydrolase n=1 Tax=Actimicrobium antarcticum TaxID=1051899 RepID=UPI0031DC7C33